MDDDACDLRARLIRPDGALLPNHAAARRVLRLRDAPWKVRWQWLVWKIAPRACLRGYDAFLHAQTRRPVWKRLLRRRDLRGRFALFLVLAWTTSWLPPINRSPAAPAIRRILYFTVREELVCAAPLLFVKPRRVARSPPICGSIAVR